MNYEIELAPSVKLHPITGAVLALQAAMQGTRNVIVKNLNQLVKRRYCA